MNLIIVDGNDFVGENRVRLEGRRHEHIVSTLKKKVDEWCKVGRLGGLIGGGKIVELTSEFVVLDLELSDSPPKPLNATLIMALPRPKTLRKVLHYAGTIGIKEFNFIGSFKVEKSYWSSPFLEPEYLHELMLLALEQSVDTLPWHIEFHRYFKPFAEDIFPQLACNHRVLVCHPGGVDIPAPAEKGKKLLLCLGPEGGFTDYEVSLLSASQSEVISLGNRILRTEVALPFLLGKLF